MNETNGTRGGTPHADPEIERLVAALPFRAPSAMMDARIAASAHLESRPRFTRMGWSSAAAAAFLVGTGIAIGWSLRPVSERAWVPSGTQWQSAGMVDIGARVLRDGRIVKPSGAVLVRTDRLRNAETGAVAEVTSLVPRIVVGRPQPD